MIRKWMLRQRFPNIGMRPLPVTRRVDGPRLDPASYELSPSSSLPTCDQLRRLLDARKLRGEFFGSHLFVDPAWDILLRAYVALLEEEPVLISTLCRMSIVPATTTLRWINVLEQDRWLVRRDDPTEGQGSRLALTAAGKLAMESYLASVWPLIPL